MKLPHSYFWHLTKSPVMLYNGRLYPLEKYSGDRKTNIININGDKYEFIELETLSELESLYRNDFSKDIDKFKTNFLNNKLRNSIQGHIKWRLKNLEKTRQEADKNNSLLLILEKIIPELEGKNPLTDIEEYSREISTDESSSIKDELGNLEKIQFNEKVQKMDIKGVLLSESLNANKSKGDDSILGKTVFHGFNLIMLPGNKFFVFSNTKGKNTVCINNGSEYYLKEYKEYDSISSIENIYLSLILDKLRYEALGECKQRIKELDGINKQQVLLNKIIKRGEFHGKKCGFYTLNSGKIVFYLNFPRFVNKFPEGGYYVFPSGQIAIGATYNKQRKDFVILRDSITVLSRYYHPFTQPFKDSDESHFCIGIYNIPRAGKGYEKIPQVLVELKTLLMSGYNQYHTNSSNIYNHPSSRLEEIGLSSVRRKGLQVTNANIAVNESITRRHEEW